MKFALPKNEKKLILLFFLGILVILELVWVASRVNRISLNWYLSQLSQLKKERETKKVGLSLSPQRETFEVGETFFLRVNLNSLGYRISGADVILSYDPRLLEVVDADDKTSGIQVVTFNKSLASYPVNKVDPKEGTIKFAVAFDPELSVSGEGTLATIVFKVLKPGVAAINFDFTPSVTTDSNVGLYGKAEDILSEVGNGKYTLR